MAKAIYTGVAGVARKVKTPYIGVGDKARKIKAGYIGVAGIARKFYEGGIPISNFSVGETVKVNVNGTLYDFIIVHRGKPSGIYDDSCDGTWLLMKNAYTISDWNSSNVNNYGKSTMHTYLNGTFLNLLGSSVINTIKEVKIPYGTGGTTVLSGSDGLATKVFLLSATEIGLGKNKYSYPVPKDGEKLDYFLYETSPTSARAIRVAYSSGTTAIKWFTRSPASSGTTAIWYVDTNGSCSYDSITSISRTYVRPAFIVSNDALVSDDLVLQ